MLQQVQEKAKFGVAGNAVEDTYPGASARGRYAAMVVIFVKYCLHSIVHLIL